MADIRIKDITTTASASLTGDFLPIDGTTGTRKLSAFSPTFGGNATVTGTLTVNGAATLSATGTNTIAGVLQFSNATPYLFPNAADKTLTIYGSSNANVGLTLYGDTHATKASQAEFIGSTLVRVLATTASTTTSTGALVVSGGVGVAGNINAGGTTFRLNSKLLAVGDGTTTYLYSQGSGGFILRNAADSADVFRVTNAGLTSVLDTTASTTTSSGALVVSGGVGVGKQIVAAEDIVIDPTDASPENLAPEAAFCRSVGLATSSSVLAFGSDARVGLLRGYQDGGNLVEWRFGSYIGSTFNEQMRLGGTSATSSSLTLYGTTASTSTSSGALVVSGGVGVAGAIYAGGGISSKLSTNNSGSNLFAITRADGTTPLLTATDASDGLTLKLGYTGLGNSSNWVSAAGTGAGTAITINNGVVASLGGVIYQVNGLARWYVSRDASTSESGSNAGSDFLITAYNDAGSSLGAALTIKRSDYAATFGSSIKTAAPSGGTAANWKLGTVATVSPTSPNRTIEVDIGGTIYYIAAKTTNN